MENPGYIHSQAQIGLDPCIVTWMGRVLSYSLMTIVILIVYTIDRQLTWLLESKAVIPPQSIIEMYEY